MANLKELRNRISSVSSTMQITSAMKMVSAAKLKRAQDAIVELRPYAEKLEEILVNLSAGMEGSEGAYNRRSKEVKKVLLVVVSSNRGLCGAFNSNVVKAVQRYREESSAQVEALFIGKKAQELVQSRMGLSAVSTHNELFDDLTYANTAKLAEVVMDKFLNEEYDRIELVYNQFVNAASQRVQVEQFLPIREVEGDKAQTSSVEYIYEPNKAEILEDLIPKSLKTQFFKALLDSNASEHGARMTAMHKATDNAGELKRNLSLEYNKARQAAITNEILEIVGGANALEDA